MGFIIENDLLVKYEHEQGEEHITVPASVSGIGQHAFEASAVQSVSIGNNVTKIETGAFSKCGRLTQITIPGSVNAVYSYAFSDCTALESAVCPDNLLHYGEHVFRGCRNLKTIKSDVSGAMVYCDDLKKEGIVFAVPDGYNTQILAGMYIDACVKSSCFISVVSSESEKILYKLWIALENENPDLIESVRALFMSTKGYDFEKSDSYFRSMKSTRNKAYYAYTRLKYPYCLNDEYAIMFRNFLKRFGTNSISFFIDDDTPEEFEFAWSIGMFEKADYEELIDYSEEIGKGDIARLLEQYRDRGSGDVKAAVSTLTPQQIRKLNEPVFQRLQERKAKLNRAAAERLASASGNSQTLAAILIDNVKADNRAQVRSVLASSPVFTQDVLLECCAIAVENDDSYMLQDLFESLPELTADIAADMLEKAVIAGKTDTVKFICVFADKINPYSRALGYAMRQANYEMTAAILSRDDQMLKDAEYIRNVFQKLDNTPEKAALRERLVDVQYLDYNYYDDDFRYLLLNCNRNGLIGDEFYDVHYTLVRLASTEKRIAFIKRMYETGLFTRQQLEYICFLAIDSDEIPIARAAVDMGIDDIDVKRCSVMANHVTTVDHIGDLLTSNPKRPSDEKFYFILSRLKPGEKLRIRKQYLLKSADVTRTLAMLRHSSLEYCDDIDLTIEYFVRHGSVEAVELLCQWGKEDACFDAAQRLKKTEIVAWILNYKNEHSTRLGLDDRFAL